MKSVLVLALVLIVETGCGGRTAAPAKPDSSDQVPGIPVKPIAVPKVDGTDGSEKLKQSKESPYAFRRIDFKNLSYPISWKNERISLQDGKREYYEHKNLGNGWFELEDVYFADITGDKSEEAIVVLTAVLCGASCDGGSYLFYFYSVEKSKLRLQWRFETGSLGYGCGLKSFFLGKRRLTLEVFNTCFFSGALLERRGDLEKRTGKFYAELITRFVLEFEGRKPELKRREILPTPQEELRSYRAQINIVND